MTTTTPEQPTTYLLTEPDLARLEAMAERISEPIVEVVAAIAMERDKAQDEASKAKGRVESLGNLLVGVVGLLNAQGYSPTYAGDRDVWEEAKAVAEAL